MSDESQSGRLSEDAEAVLELAEKIGKRVSELDSEVRVQEAKRQHFYMIGAFLIVLAMFVLTPPKESFEPRVWVVAFLASVFILVYIMGLVLRSRLISNRCIIERRIEVEMLKSLISIAEDVFSPNSSPLVRTVFKVRLQRLSLILERD